MHAFNRQTDGQTDRILIARLRLHSMQHGINNRTRALLHPSRSYACSIVLSKLDYCKSLLYGAPKTTGNSVLRMRWPVW